MQAVTLDDRNRDANGWDWGPGPPVWHIGDGADSLTVRSPSPVAALWLAMRDGWPPRTVRRIGWEYQT